jgi:hypothetical protein
MTDDELRNMFDLVLQEIAQVRQENTDAHAETRLYIDQKVTENRHFFQVLHEGTKHEIGLVAEKVVHLDEKLDNVKNELEERMEQGFTETQAMIKFSHAELDRRMRTLEENHRALEESLIDLVARVERLEGSTH